MSLGRDVSCVDDFEPDMREVEGFEGLGQALARRLMTDRGGLWYDPEYGYNLTKLIGTSKNPATIASEVEAECLKDGRVEDCRAVVTREGNRLQVVLSVVTAEGPHTYVVSASEATVVLLAA